MALKVGAGGRVALEFDERNSRANKAKHGIDFVGAQALWLDEALAETPACRAGEARFLVVGLMGDGRCHVARTAGLRLVRSLRVLELTVTSLNQTL